MYHRFLGMSLELIGLYLLSFDPYTQIQHPLSLLILGFVQKKQKRKKTTKLALPLSIL